MKKLMLAALAAAALGAQAAEWRYDSNTDKMTGKKENTAALQSDNSLSLGFPYAGQNRGNLIVRQHPQHGLDILLIVEKGQILCGFQGCNVLVRFDDAQPARYPAARSSSGDSTVIFIEQTKKFISNAQKAKKILVQFEMFQSGNQVLEFSTPKPLVWPAK